MSDEDPARWRPLLQFRTAASFLQAYDCEKAERTYIDCGLGKWSVGATASDVPCSDGGS